MSKENLQRILTAAIIFLIVYFLVYPFLTKFISDGYAGIIHNSFLIDICFIEHIDLKENAKYHKENKKKIFQK